MLRQLLVTLLVLSSCGIARSSPLPSPLPDGYYYQLCQKPKDLTLVEWFEQLEPPQPWMIDDWDCSQVSAWTEWLAENCGYHTLIAFRYSTDQRDGHAWLLVDIDDEWRAYEATLGLWFDYREYNMDGAHESPADTYWGSAPAFYKSWGWWISHPELVKGG